MNYINYFPAFLFSYIGFWAVELFIQEIFVLTFSLVLLPSVVHYCNPLYWKGIISSIAYCNAGKAPLQAYK